MNKFKKGQELIIERDVAISVYEMNGIEIDQTIEYPKGEVFEILEALDAENYKIEFWTDSNEKVNNKPVTYEFDEETILEWLKPVVD